MNRIFFALLLIFPFVSNAQRVDVSTTKGSVNFTYDKSTEGTLGGVSATIHFDLSDLSKGSVSGSVDVSTLDTKIKMRNKHLRGKDYFDVENYPKMTFRSTSISESGGVYTVKGKLKIKSTEKDVVFKVTKSNGNLVFTTTIYGLDYDVAISKNREKTKVKISVIIPM